MVLCTLYSTSSRMMRLPGGGAAQLTRRIFLIMAFHGVVASPVEMPLLEIDGATYRVLYGSHDPVHCPWDTIVHELVAMHLPPFMHTQEAIAQIQGALQGWIVRKKTIPQLDPTTTLLAPVDDRYMTRFK